MDVGDDLDRRPSFHGIGRTFGACAMVYRNYGFDELVNGWHADHVYKHHRNAIEAFALLAFSLFHAENLILCQHGGIGSVS